MKEILYNDAKLFGLIPHWVKIGKTLEDNDPEIEKWEILIKILPTLYKIRVISPSKQKNRGGKINANM